MFKKLFGKKNDGFYLQLEEDSNAPAKVEAKAEPIVAAAPVAIATQSLVQPETPTVTPVAGATKSEAQTKSEVQIAKAEQKAQAKAEKSAKKLAAEAAKKAEAELAAAAAAAKIPVAPVIKNFATDYLIKPSSNSSRRQPGANMNMFLDMARQVEKPMNIKDLGRKVEKPAVEKPAVEKPTTVK